MQNLTYKIENLNFDGPLDLLFNLLEKNKVDIRDIPIAEITRQYLEYVSVLKEMGLEEISGFLLMAAELLEIKAKMLLPKEKDEETGEEIDPREELAARLLEYKRYKFIAHELRFYDDYGERFLYHGEEIPEYVAEYRPPLDLNALLKDVTAERLRSIFEEAMRRKEFKKDDVRAGFGVIHRERISIGNRLEHLVRFTKINRKFSFRQVLEEQTDVTEVVVTFLAVLELMKTGKVEAQQTAAGGDIEFTVNADIEDGDLHIEDIADN